MEAMGFIHHLALNAVEKNYRLTLEQYKTIHIICEHFLKFTLKIDSNVINDITSAIQA